jgi:hypothetical protein
MSRSSVPCSRAIRASVFCPEGIRPKCCTARVGCQHEQRCSIVTLRLEQSRQKRMLSSSKKDHAFIHPRSDRLCLWQVAETSSVRRGGPWPVMCPICRLFVHGMRANVNTLSSCRSPTAYEYDDDLMRKIDAVQQGGKTGVIANLVQAGIG